MTSPAGPSAVEGRDVLLIFLKSPRVGTVKTRLFPALGPVRATTVYRRLAEDTVDRTTGPAHAWATRHCFAPDDAGPELETWLGPDRDYRPQGPGDLGDRLIRAFDDAFAGGARRVAVIGTDAPDLGGDEVRALFAALDAADVAMIPAVDGGYAGLALTGPRPELFVMMPWSTAAVAGETLARAATLGLRTARLGTVRDVDEPADWDALSDRTRAYLLGS